jgi:hypothetical protein
MQYLALEVVIGILNGVMWAGESFHNVLTVNNPPPIIPAP